MSRKQIALFNSQQVGLILQAGTGIEWRSWVDDGSGAQADGGFWQERSMEGVYVPLSNDAPEGWPSLEQRLRQVWGEESPQADGSSTTNVFALNEVLAEISSSDVISIDQTLLAEAVTGWLPVLVEPQGDFSLLQGFERGKGVVVWPLS